jgi:hypothetical protein
MHVKYKILHHKKNVLQPGRTFGTYKMIAHAPIFRFKDLIVVQKYEESAFPQVSQPLFPECRLPVVTA